MGVERTDSDLYVSVSGSEDLALLPDGLVFVSSVSFCLYIVLTCYHHPPPPPPPHHHHHHHHCQLVRVIVMVSAFLKGTAVGDID